MMTASSPRLIALTAFVALLAIGSFAVRPAAAQDTSRPDQERVIAVSVGRSTVVQAPWPAKRVSVTDPEIADIQVLTPDRVLLMGKAIGSTDLVMWSETEEAWQARVDVSADLGQFRAELATLFPGATLDVRQSHDVVVVSGFLGQADQVEQLRRYLEATGLNYVDMTTIAGVQQVEISVRVAEASRTAIRALGLNLLYTGNDDNVFFGGMTVGSDSGGAIVPISIGPGDGVVTGVTKASAAPGVPFTYNADVSISPLVTLFGGFPRADLEFFLQALSENQYLQILAEPNLAALSGEEATFLAGGEFPIPVVQGGISGNTSITIEYKQFGVLLKFRPVVLGDGGIRLQVATEVSELSDAGAVEIQGFRVPAVVSRRAETTLELKSGQTFGMAGLIRRTTEARSSRLPWLGDIPVLGALFRSIRYVRGETELVVLVTASLVEPTSLAASDIPVPGSAHIPPDDWELYALGQLEGTAAPCLAPLDAQWLKDVGLDRLQGPGAWVRYGSPSAPSQAPAQPAPPPVWVEDQEADVETVGNYSESGG